MAYTYEQLDLGGHPYGLNPSERKKKKSHLAEMQKLLQKMEQQLQEDLEQTTKEEQTKALEEQIKRAKHQQKLVAKRAELLEAADKTEAKIRESIKEKKEPLFFTTDVTISSELKEAIIAFGINGDRKYDAALKVAKGYGIEQASAIRNMAANPKRMDLRDFGDMIEVVPNAEIGELEKITTEFAQDYMNYESGNPELRKARLDEFYDRIDAIDPFSLDLSCITGKDTGTRSGPDQLTPSERDFMKLIDCCRADQAFQTKEFENQEYFNARYSDPKTRTQKTLIRDLLFNKSLMQYITLGILPMNGVLQNLKPHPDALYGVNELASLSAQMGFQLYQQDMAALLGEPCDMALHFKVPENLVNQFYKYGKPDADKSEFKPTSEYFEPLFGPLYSSATTKEYMKEAGLDFEDMIFIDGISAKEKLEKEYPEIDEAEKETAIRHMAMKAMMSGEHRVEFARIQMNEKGTYSMQVSSIQPDLHALDHSEKTHERKGLFGLLKHKETRADRIDKLWAKDPEREVRQNKIRDQVNRKIMASINKRTPAVAVEQPKKTVVKMNWKEFEEVKELNVKYGNTEAHREKLKKECYATLKDGEYAENAFFGWAAMNGKTSYIAVSEAIRPKLAEDMKMKNLEISAFMQNKGTLAGLFGMTLDEPLKMSIEEVISNDPQYDAKKELVGKEFVKQMSRMGTAEFSEIFIKMEQTLEQQSFEPFANHDFSNLTLNLRKINFLSQAVTAWNEVITDQVKENMSPKLDNAAERLRRIQPLQSVSTYADFAVSDDYLIADTEKVISRNEARRFNDVATAYICRDLMETMAKQCKGAKTLGEACDKAGTSLTERQALLDERKWEITGYAANKHLQEITDFIKTGKSPCHKIDKDDKKLEFHFPEKTIQRQTGGKRK